METLEDVLNEADLAGFPVSKSQLHRWRHAGIVPRPQREGLGRGEGSESWYPRGTSDLVIVVAASLEERRDLTTAGWRAWLLGHDVTPFVRKQMQQRIDVQERIRERHRQRVERGSLLTIMGPEILGEIRGRFGKADALHIERLFAEVMLGEFDGSWLRSEDHSRMVEALTNSSDSEVGEWVSKWSAYASDLIGTRALESLMDRISNDELRRTQWELIRLSGLTNPVLGTGGLRWAPVNLLHLWLPVRWGELGVSRTVQDFFADPEWPSRTMAWIEENLVQ